MLSVKQNGRRIMARPLRADNEGCRLKIPFSIREPFYFLLYSLGGRLGAESADSMEPTL